MGGRTTQFPSTSSPKRDCGPKREGNRSPRPFFPRRPPLRLCERARAPLPPPDPCCSVLEEIRPAKFRAHETVRASFMCGGYSSTLTVLLLGMTKHETDRYATGAWYVFCHVPGCIGIAEQCHAHVARNSEYIKNSTPFFSIFFLLIPFTIFAHLLLSFQLVTQIRGCQVYSPSYLPGISIFKSARVCQRNDEATGVRGCPGSNTLSTGIDVKCQIRRDNTRRWVLTFRTSAPGRG